MDRPQNILSREAASLRVESEKQDLEIPVPGESVPVADLLQQHALPLNTRCGKRSLCDGCLIELTAGELVHRATGQRADATEGPLMLRGCEYQPAAGRQAAIRIPPRSLLAHEPQVVSDFAINIPFAHDPLWSGGGRQTAGVVGMNPTLLAGSPGLAAAIDIGTTTVAVALIDLADGRIITRESHFNRQMHLGDDVLTRINLCRDPAMIHALQQAVGHQTIAPLIHRALRKADARLEQLRGLVVAGNTTMLHLLLGIDPSPLGVVPFKPAFLEHRLAPADELGLIRADVEEQRQADEAAGRDSSPPAQVVGMNPALPAPAVHLLPGAAAYVGADIVAGCLASGLVYDHGPCLLVDIGTNGEIVLKHDGRLTACATAAGPAFEGARLTAGIRAARGAISHLALHRNPFRIELDVIDDDRPIGICGSAYIDFLAEARRIGLISPAGRFEDDAADYAGPHLRRDDHARSLRIARGRGGRDIAITESDIASLLQAKAAIAAGILTLLELVRIRPQDIRALYLAGGFGLHLGPRSAIACGLLPGFTPEQIQVVGNTSLAGAYLAMLDRSLLDVLQETAAQIQVIELNLAPGFEDRYIEQLMLP